MAPPTTEPTTIPAIVPSVKNRPLFVADAVAMGGAAVSKPGTVILEPVIVGRVGVTVVVMVEAAAIVAAAGSVSVIVPGTENLDS